MQRPGHIRQVPLWRSVTRFDGAKIASGHGANHRDTGGWRGERRSGTNSGYCSGGPEIVSGKVLRGELAGRLTLWRASCAPQATLPGPEQRS